MTKSTKRVAFTLAEVLITLGIIGVVSAMTIPSLITKFQKDKTVNQLKKSYTELSQAVKLSEVDNGPSQSWDWGIEYSSYTSGDSFDTYWKPYLKILKICSYYNDCGYKKQKWDIVVGTNVVGVHTDGSRTLLILADGTILLITSNSTDSEGNPVPYKRVFIDINGAKPPNSIGLDIFVFSLETKGLMPYGAAGNCQTDAKNCAAKIIEDGWQIKDDYPWK